MLKNLFSDQKNLINAFFDTLDLEKAQLFIDIIVDCPGCLFFSGVGKSGLIAKKIAGTFSSIGIKAFYLSPVDTLHGDIGRIAKDDLFIMLSKSGYTGELLELAPHIRRKKAKILSLVCNENTPMQEIADISIYLPLQKELCPFNLAPTISSTIQLIFGDFLAVACMQKKKLTKEIFAQNHPAGSIGKKLLVKVGDLMKVGPQIPTCSYEDKLIDILPILSEKRCGAIIITDDNKKLIGIFTDGDLRRALQNNPERALQKAIGFYSNRNPKFISPNTLALNALKFMEKDPKKLVMVLPVIEDERVVGILHMHDILQIGLKS